MVLARGRRVRGPAASARRLLSLGGGSRPAGRALSRGSLRQHRRRDLRAAQPAADVHDRSLAMRQSLFLSVVLASACSRSNLDAVTGVPTGDGGTDTTTPV